MHQVTDVVCPGCGCACDDLTLTIDEDRLVEVAPDCPIARRWFFENATLRRPAFQIDGQTSSLPEALQTASSILQQSVYPLIYGLSRSCTAGQRAAVRLADRLGAVIDTTASLCHGPSIIAVQSVGESTCSLGEVRHRCDLVIYWGCNPAESHPRHAERYSTFPPGRFVPEGRQGRTVVMVGDAGEVNSWRLDVHDARPDFIVPIEPGRDFEVISALRGLLQGIPVSENGFHSSGASPEHLQRLAELMTSCRSGVVFFGLGLTETSFEGPWRSSTFGHANVESLLRLVEELNAFTRFYARRLRVQGDVSGADTVLCWQTGFPFSVNLARGYPRYNPGEYSAWGMLEREEPDACLLIGSETVGAFPDRAIRHLRSIPTIVLDYPGAEMDFVPSVLISTTPYGLAARGTIYRMDEVPLPLQAPLRVTQGNTPATSSAASDEGCSARCELPTDEDVLVQIEQML